MYTPTKVGSSNRIQADGNGDGNSNVANGGRLLLTSNGYDTAGP